MKLKKVKCAYCGKEFEIATGQYNYRVVKHGLNIYCSRKHFGMARRMYLPTVIKKQEKAEYDKEYRVKNEKKLKKRQKAYFKKDYAANPEKYRQQRKRRQKEHNEYCRRPEYKKWKQEYDKQYRAKKIYGQLWESAIALNELAKIVDNRQAKQQQKSINKTQNRKRYANKNTKRKELESCTMGLYQPS